MNIKENKITVRELVDGYEERSDESVVAYSGKLDVRPPYQRSFIYKDAERNLVIDTLCKNHPLSLMYWAVCPGDEFEVIDGQQRAISICEYVIGNFAVRGLFGNPNPREFHNLQPDEQEKVCNYEMTVYFCDGTDSEKLEWFRTINIAGKALTEQELRNAVYHGKWVTSARRYFSTPNYGADGEYAVYLTGPVNRQKKMETALRWIAARDGEGIEDYMAKMSGDPAVTEAAELVEYFEAVMDWVVEIFPEYFDAMKSVQWGFLYNAHGEREHDAAAYKARIAALMADEDVTNRTGIYEYILSGRDSHLNIRAFKPSDKQAAFARQGKKCNACKKAFALKEMEADHIQPWSENGPSILENCQMLCKECHKEKTAKQAQAKARG